MATTSKAAASKKTTKAVAPKAAPKAAAKAAPKAAAKTAAPKAAAPKAAAAAVAPKAVKSTFTKPSLIAYLVEQTGLDSKAVKTVMATLEQTILGAASKKGVGEFTLPGLLKITTQKVAAKKKRVGKNPFTGEMQEFAAKPATVRVKIRALKKLKDAAI